MFYVLERDREVFLGGNTWFAAQYTNFLVSRPGNLTWGTPLGDPSQGGPKGGGVTNGLFFLKWAVGGVQKVAK